MFMIHWATAVIRMVPAISFKICRIPVKFTLPCSMISSTAKPVSLGRYSVSATVTAASTRDSAR